MVCESSFESALLKCFLMAVGSSWYFTTLMRVHIFNLDVRSTSILWMDEILHHLANPERMIPLYLPTNNGINHGCQVVRNGFRKHPQYERTRKAKLLLLARSKSKWRLQKVEVPPSAMCLGRRNKEPLGAPRAREKQNQPPACFVASQ